MRKRLAALTDADSPDRDVVEHVAACAECRRFYHLLKGADSALRALGPSALPPDLAARAAEAALRASATRGGRDSFVERLLPVAWPAAAVAVAVAVLLLLRAPAPTRVEQTQTATLEDPVTAVTVLPLQMSDPARALIGEDESLGGEE